MKLKLFCDDPVSLVHSLAVQVCKLVKEDFVVVGVLDAAYLMVADFVKKCQNLGRPVHGVGFYTAKSREGIKQVPLSDVWYLSSKTTPLEGCAVVLLDVIAGSGKTLIAVKNDIVLTQNAKSVYSATLFIGPDPQVLPLVDNQPFTIPLNHYLIGYGLDLSGRFRYLDKVYDLIDNRDPEKVDYV